MLRTFRVVFSNSLILDDGGVDGRGDNDYYDCGSGGSGGNGCVVSGALWCVMVAMMAHAGKSGEIGCGGVGGVGGVCGSDGSGRSYCGDNGDRVFDWWSEANSMRKKVHTQLHLHCR
jgi:hypothetical protein